jgi:hypothetical protein
MRLFISDLVEHSRFYILALAILFLMIGQWVGDFWEHSAVVHELITHPSFP